MGDAALKLYDDEAERLIDLLESEPGNDAKLEAPTVSLVSVDSIERVRLVLRYWGMSKKGDNYCEIGRVKTCTELFGVSSSSSVKGFFMDEDDSAAIDKMRGELLLFNPRACKVLDMRYRWAYDEKVIRVELNYSRDVFKALMGVAEGFMAAKILKMKNN